MEYEKKLQQILDKQELYELVVSYCRAMDRHDWDLVRELYHPDAIDDHGSLFYGNREEFLAFLPGPIVNFSATTHHITNTLFRIDGDYAEGESYLIASHITREDPPRNLMVSGRYLDRFERRDGVWRFIYRSSLADWANMPADELMEILPPILDRPPLMPSQDKTDPPIHCWQCSGVNSVPNRPSVFMEDMNLVIPLCL